MKRLIVTAVALLGCTSMNAMADCASPQIKGKDLSTLVTGNTVCANNGGDRWQEQHRGGGQLWDYKMGPSHAIDPSEQVGTWSINGNNVTYSYTSGGSYTYEIHGPAGGPYTFCPVGGGTQINNAIFKTGQVGC